MINGEQEEKGYMRKAVLFDEFSLQCPFSDININDGYGCDHPDQKEIIEKSGKEYGCCYCHTCPLGIEAEQQDLTDKESSDAIQDEIDWDGLCEEGEVIEGEYLLIVSDETATEAQKEALYYYDRYMHRYDRKWLDEHGIDNSLCS